MERWIRVKEKTIVRRLGESMHKGKREKRQRNDPGRSESLFSLSFVFLFDYFFFFPLETMRDFF